MYKLPKKNRPIFPRCIQPPTPILSTGSDLETFFFPKSSTTFTTLTPQTLNTGLEILKQLSNIRRVSKYSLEITRPSYQHRRPDTVEATPHTHTHTHTHKMDFNLTSSWKYTNSDDRALLFVSFSYRAFTIMCLPTATHLTKYECTQSQTLVIIQFLIHVTLVVTSSSERHVKW